MNDEILQHHFDEVFSALQDRENFEIFTKIKPTKSPKVKKTFFKIVTPSEVNSIASFDCAGILERTPRRYNSQNCFKLSAYDSRPSSASINTVRARAVFRPNTRPLSPRASLPRPTSPRLASSRPNSPRPFSRGSTPRSSSRTLSPRPISPRPPTPSSVGSNSRYMSLKDNASDILGECKHCGRYFLGDYLIIHEEKCGEDNFDI